MRPSLSLISRICVSRQILWQWSPGAWSQGPAVPRGVGLSSGRVQDAARRTRHESSGLRQQPQPDPGANDPRERALASGRTLPRGSLGQLAERRRGPPQDDSWRTSAALPIQGASAHGGPAQPCACEPPVQHPAADRLVCHASGVSDPQIPGVATGTLLRQLGRGVTAERWGAARVPATEIQTGCPADLL